MKVPQLYVVPTSYPQHLHHLPLGLVVCKLRCRSIAYTSERVQRISDLDALGFLWRLSFKNATFCVVHRPGQQAPLAQTVAWSEQIEALLVFRRLHGHVNVPDGFIVPPEADVWPLPMHYVALDLALASLRAYVYELPEADADRLREAGYFADLPDFCSFIELLAIYRDEFGSCAVRIDFVVPRMGGLWINAWRGLALGDLAWSVGLKARALKAAQHDDLQLAGFVFNVDATWANIVRGLEHFRSLYGPLAVPTSFVAPATWPSDLAGLRLGHYVERMHTAKRLRLLPHTTASTFAALTQIPPVASSLWAPPRDANARVEVLQQLRDVVRVVRDVHIAVPDEFVVPASGSAWPADSGGVQLGVRLRWFWQHKQLSLPVCDEIRALGVRVANRSAITDELPPTAPAPKSRTWTTHDMMCALGFYRLLRGSARVLLSYPVPIASPWPPQLQGVPVAVFAKNLRYYPRVLDDKLEVQLKLVGFSWPTFWVPSTRCVKRTTRDALAVGMVPIAAQVAALHTYQCLVGDVLAMPKGFAVPLNDAAWPAGSSGIVLSYVLPSLRYHWFELAPEDEATVRALGLFTDVPPFDVFVQLAFRLSCDGKTTVPLDFVVPAEWSASWRGAPLGELAWSLGVRMAHLKLAKSNQLVAIGFEFNSPATWAHIVDGLRTYHSLCGLTDVPEDFLVPQTASWPKDMHGMRLGHWVKLLVSARELYLLPATTTTAIDAIGADAPMPEAVSISVGVNAATPAISAAATNDTIGADAPPPVATTLSSDENSAAPAILASAATTTVVQPAVIDAPLPVVVAAPLPVVVRPLPVVMPQLPAVVPLPSVAEEQPAVQAAPALAVDADTNERCDHLVALDLWLHATPRPSDLTLLGSLSPACPVALQPLSVGAFLLELEVGQAFTHLQSALDDRQFDRQARWAIKFQALAMFKAFNGHLDVPRTFTVDANATWPAPTHGLRLGDVVFGLRRLTTAEVVPAIVAQLDALGFGWAALPVAVATDAALLPAPEPPASIVEAVPVAPVQNATASARGASSSTPADVKGGFDRDDDKQIDKTAIKRSKPSKRKCYETIDLCSTDDDDDNDNDGDDGAGIDYDVKDDGIIDAMPVQAIRTNVRRRRQNNTETTASVRRRLANEWGPPRGHHVFMPTQPIDDEFPWRSCLGELRRFFIKHEHSNVPFTYVSEENNVPLGRLVHQLRQSQIYLTESHLDELRALKFMWQLFD
ncbi:hypothetical protein SDRG_15026 [Saprolegnia diclina VS20]|uniref:Helicase-associated domain-containing protein n=1 Tax=Saprolegnia diclina (strain VS20) TaxID=1156394 RepID=T0Q181_SAPDV|nr:hypothetical protein SDRG_15026 [Saprolegnia diclina VS20]EQC27125.1 hypothetical protein SDRG_15026 [Saprolegnia diclina VS20]|eukprot:XP_008619411.1 hypothetical protein SDRG_15026 [Saprolegnia diclina VS20]